MNIFDLLLTNPFAVVLRFIMDFVQNHYWIALLLFTIFVKVVLFPLTVKQKKGMLDQARIQPKLKELEKKYKGNKEKYNQEMQKLYQTENVSLLGGCLPLLITIPIMFALYAIIRQPLTWLMQMSGDEIRAIYRAVVGQRGAITSIFESASKIIADMTASSPSMIAQNGALVPIIDSASKLFADVTAALAQSGSGQINNMQVHVAALFRDNFEAIRTVVSPGLADKVIPINFNFFGVPLGGEPRMDTPNVLWLIPIVSAGSSYLLTVVSQKTNGMPPASGGQGKMMTYMSPIISLFLGFSLPAALSLYWIFNNLCTMAQEPLAVMYIRKKYPEKYGAAAMAAVNDSKKKKELPTIIIEKDETEQESEPTDEA